MYILSDYNESIMFIIIISSTLQPHKAQQTWGSEFHITVF